MSLFGEVSSTESLVRQIDVTIDQFRKGATAPTDATVGSTPTVPALLFDATTELATVTEDLPIDMDLTVDPVLTIIFSLVNSQINNDTADLTFDYVAPIKEVTGSGPAKASTTATATTTVTTANGLAVDDMYSINLTIDAADATNPLASAEALSIEMHLTNVTGVAAIHMLSAHLRYTAKY